MHVFTDLQAVMSHNNPPEDDVALLAMQHSITRIGERTTLAQKEAAIQSDWSASAELL